ncbi:MAG: response regulator transcription factor [Armatimonadetes bacterium]|nr:response regulator transcription factor [Armatimonadota bacterium]
MARATILLVDDQPQILVPLRRKFEAEGFQVLTATNGAHALEAFAAAKPDVVVLDLMMPEIDGLTVCKRIRALSEVPIIVLSAKSEESDIVLGLELGADDYLTKPFRINELVSRVRALLRRPALAPSHKLASGVLEAGKLRLSQDTREVMIDGRPAALSPTEFRLLEVLMRRPGHVLGRETLLEAVWGYQGYDERLINTYIKRLREKLERDPANPELILTVRGFGYKISA